MIFRYKFLSVISFSILFFSCGLFAQTWTLAKEKDGVKVFTRTENNSPWKSFRGEVTFRGTVEKVSSMLGNNKNFDWWDKAVTDVKVLDFKENRFVQYYMIYELPWPLTNRDIVTETIITDDMLTGIRIYEAKPLPGKIPEKPNLVRVKSYRQVWTVQPQDKGNVRVIFEGSLDPGGHIPHWLYNLVITETPLKMLNSLRGKVLSGT